MIVPCSGSLWSPLPASQAASLGAGATRSYTVCADWFRLKLAAQEHEVFAAAWLDTQRRLIAFEELARGAIDSTCVSVREVVKSALSHNASAVVFAHNHPVHTP